MTTTPPRINPRLGAAALRAPAASREDSHPHAILKLQPRNSFDYRVGYEPQLNPILYSYLFMKEEFSLLIFSLSKAGLKEQSQEANNRA